MDADLSAELENTFLAIAGVAAGTGVVKVPGSDRDTLAVKYLHVRGILDPDGDHPCWAQSTVAVPVDLIPGLIAGLQK